MLRYLATVTLGVCSTVSAAGIYVSKSRESQTAANYHYQRKQKTDHPPQHYNSSSTHSDSITGSEKAKMDYQQESERVANKVYELYKDSDWKLAKTTDGMLSGEKFAKEIKVMYKKSPEFEGHIYRAECILEGTPDRIVNYVLPSPKGLRGKWDKNVKESEVLEDVDDSLIVARSATHSAAMGLISSRDFVDLIMIKRYDDGIVTTNSKSIQRKDCPPKDGFVRGVNYHGGTICIPIIGEQNKTKVINLVQTDLGGMLPTSLVESALPSNLIDFFVDLEKALRSEID